MKKVLSLVMALTLILALLASCGTSGAGGASGGAASSQSSGGIASKVTLKLGTKMSEDSFEGKCYQYFADLVNERTGGEVEVVVYPSEQLGDAQTQVSNLQLGTQELYGEGGNYFTGYSNMFEITNIPFLFSSNEQFIDLVQGDYGKEQQEVMEQNGFHIVNTNRDWLRGPYRVICSVKPLQTLEDFKGLRFRTHESDMYMKCWSTLGTNPIVINWGETYLAIQQGTAEAVASPVSQIEDMGFYEVAPYITEIDEYPQEILIVANLEVWNKLSEEQQGILTDAANETAAYSNGLLQEEVDASIARMEEAGATFYKLDTKPCTEALMDVYRDMVSAGTLPEGILEQLGY
ncbi:TRAP transporter substrate-binding protein [Oscillibacter sp. MSJ-2]|uniref:TRAP transporter substrate-binding protein n=1 Tax=Dysosmobacter acutus TaxID=2841504 RepID=A0ABS6F8J0_9FIRM|nr:TRAP transporter substrate-binding protein [Dysosmobacter acutus]MBU5626613.1 TRAP transporter substrate-binding protein [Dysosmobacter acutus]